VSGAPAPDLPDALVVFDGACAFCSGWVRLLLRLDREGILRFAPVQSAVGRAACRRSGVDPDDPSTFLFLDRGRAYARSDAFAALLGRLPAPWRAFRGLRHLPRPLRDGLYGVVARNRYRLFGRRDDCMMPSPEVRARFLLDPPQGT